MTKQYLKYFYEVQKGDYLKFIDSPPFKISKVEPFESGKRSDDILIRFEYSDEGWIYSKYDKISDNMVFRFVDYDSELKEIEHRYNMKHIFNYGLKK